MGSKWRKAKLTLSLNLCLYVPQTTGEPSSPPPSRDAVLAPGATTTPSHSSSAFRLPRSFSKSSSKKKCAICLTAMKSSKGQAIFTAECSHSFHFNCITANVNHGNQICPVCRAKWSNVPLHNPNDKSKPTTQPRDTTIPQPRRSSPRHNAPPHVSSIFNKEPAVFDDDEPLVQQDRSGLEKTGKLEIKTYPEISEVVQSVSFNDFAVLINLKAPPASKSTSRAPIDLVTVLDVSGSMCGTKLALLKRSMGFVIQNLGPFDRLSIISFSCTARRSFPLTLMTESGKRDALTAVNWLLANGGTHITEGLKKGAKVLTDRKFENPVSSMMLLSDGHDSYNMANNRGTDFKSPIPVHTFGFGADHDASLMHSIAENSGGTFSFIETDSDMQDAFAQCIGGILNVVVQELVVDIECVHPELRIGSVKSGSYVFDDDAESRKGSIRVGDLYAEEERNFLVNLDIPTVDGVSDPMELINVRCGYKDPVTKETFDLNDSGEVTILRPEEGIGRSPVVSIEVDRQRIRLLVAEAFSEARVLAERGEFTEAVSVLGDCIDVLMDTVSGRAGDPLCESLCVELKETKERMASHQIYEARGRAYVLAGMSSHMWQRATARGDMSDTTTTFSSSYQTQTMSDMIDLSHTITFGYNTDRSSNSSASVGRSNSFPSRPKPR